MTRLNLSPRLKQGYSIRHPNHFQESVVDFFHSESHPNIKVGMEEVKLAKAYKYQAYNGGHEMKPTVEDTNPRC